MLTNLAHMDHLVRLEQNKKLHEAEQDRLVRLALAARQEWEPLFFRALAWLGRRLITWGQNPQKRRGPEIGVCVLPTANQCQCC